MLAGKVGIFVVLVGVSFAQFDPQWWGGRNTIVHLFEWKWKDIAEECETFLSKQGYAGVQVSPAQENLVVENRPWWERYQTISYNLTTRSGDERDFLDMTTRCNKVGIRIYVDVILNHMTGDKPNATGTGGSTADTGKKYYPAIPYEEPHFHDSCAISDYDNPLEVRVCELVGLKDLKQDNSHVREKMLDLLNRLVELGVAGFRVDAAKHIWPADLKYIYNNTKDLNPKFGFKRGARPFIYQEVSYFGGEAISRDEYTPLGAITEFKHAHDISRVFRGEVKLVYLTNWGTGWGFTESDKALVFIDNHDKQRDGDVLSYKSPKEYKMATAFMLAFPYGITKIMSSFDFQDKDQGPPHDEEEGILSPAFNEDLGCNNGWVCEHRWREIYQMVGFKNAVNGTGVNDFWNNGDQQFAFSRGDKGFIAFTNGGDIKATIQTGLPSGVYCDVISGSVTGTGRCTGKIVEVFWDRKAYVELGQYEFNGVLAVHVNSRQRLI